MSTEEELTRIGYYNLEGIHFEFLKYAPAYAQEEARQAIEKVRELQSQGVIRNGVYYLVLVDLVGSTRFASEHGNASVANRIKWFVTASLNAFNEATIRNAGLFLKEIGDAVLFVFCHFPDILRWRAAFGDCLKTYPRKDEPPLQARTCIHVGEVSLDGVNPLSLAVSQAFKMEKRVEGGAIVLTEPAYVMAWPTLARIPRFL